MGLLQIIVLETNASALQLHVTKAIGLPTSPDNNGCMLYMPVAVVFRIYTRVSREEVVGSFWL